MDILGFKELIDKEKFEKILNILESIYKRRSSFKVGFDQAEDGLYLKIKPDFISFSDHMIIAFPFRGDEVSDYRAYISYVASIIIRIQNDALKEGCLLRGAITVGDYYYDRRKNIIFGRALNEVIQSEQELAIYPRIIACESLLDFVKSNSLNHAHFKFDFDGVQYIDYISKLKFAQADCKKIIESGLKQSNKNIKANTKWRWLAEKFNDLPDSKNGVGKIYY